MIITTGSKHARGLCGASQLSIVCLILGKTSLGKTRFLSGIARKGGGGFTHARIFWPFFHQEKVPKIGTFLLKTNDICMFFVIIIIKITIITNVIIIKTIIIINGIFFCHTRKTSF